LMGVPQSQHTRAYLDRIGVEPLTRATSPFDPGYDPLTVESHLDQSAHLISILKISMACWLIADEGATRRKMAAAKAHGTPTVSGGGPFEIAVAQGQLPAYLDLCADIGFDRIECAEGFTELDRTPEQLVAEAREHGLEVQFELGRKHDGPFTDDDMSTLIDQGKRWLEAGAVELIIEARESAQAVGLFDEAGGISWGFAERITDAFGFGGVTFEAPNKASQFAFLSHFGPQVHLSNVRLEELLRVEIYRRGLDSDAFGEAKLRPKPLVVDS